MQFFEWFDRRREYAPFFIRLVIGVILIEGTADNVFSGEQMLEFEKFLASNGLPFPLVGAILSAYAQFICGILILLGAATRLASVVMIVNFLFALGIGHRVGGFGPARLALVILFAALFLLFHGAGKPSVDESLAKRRQ
ncbi:MAG TPA: DoxX family protein [Thermoanaerobaculia bacterium]|jgi:putative oxidoreductase